MEDKKGGGVGAAFNEAYASLNAAQRQAVDTIEGPVIVIAGPGTGKTQILTLRIANILRQTDTAPENILALTFTESGATAMRQRLVRYIGTEAYRVGIFTFHGFAGKLIAEYPDAFPHITTGRPASELDKIHIIETILDDARYKRLRTVNGAQHMVKPILDIIGKLKQEYITPDELASIISKQEQDLASMEKVHEKGAHKGKVKDTYKKAEAAIEKNQELLQVYRQYNALLAEDRLFDFGDMLVEAVQAMESNAELLLDLQETYHYVLADEHQDVNGAQNTILSLLMSYHDNPNLFVVGDEKQAIYRFQGASLENFLHFETVFKDAKTIALTDNYRSGQRILDAAHSLVAVEEGPLVSLRVPLTAAVVDDSRVEVYAFSHEAVEHDWLAESVEQDMAAGVSPSEIAVIVRTNAEVEALSARLRKAGVEVTASADGDIFSSPITKQIFALLEVLLYPERERQLVEVLHAPYWSISASDIVRISAAQTYERTLTALLSDKTLLQEIGVTDVPSVARVMEVLDEVRQELTTRAPHQLLELLLQRTGFLTHVLQRDGAEGARVIRRLYDEIESMVVANPSQTLGDVVARIRTMEAYTLPLEAPYLQVAAEAVQVMTAHKSKGLEFEVVYIPHLVDSSWGGKKRRQDFKLPLQSYELVTDAADDEKRLLFVAMTRAKRALRLSHSDTNASGRELVVSRLLGEVDEEMLTHIDTTDFEKKFLPSAAIAEFVHPPAIDAALVRTLFAKRGFSATSYNNYLVSPWTFLYRNLLRVPEIQGTSLLYGTAVHNTLEKALKRNEAAGTFPNMTEVGKMLASELYKLPLSTEDFTRQHQKGLESLAIYLPHLQQSLPTETLLEMKISVSVPTNDELLPEVLLTGKLDRIDKEEGKIIRVVDYKTGKPKTRKEITGENKNADGNYYRQLVFYALLLNLHEDDWRERTGVLSFVEPHKNGSVCEEVFEITVEEAKQLQEEIVTAAKEIAAGDFLRRPCDESQCDYCHLVDSLSK